MNKKNDLSPDGSELEAKHWDVWCEFNGVVALSITADGVMDNYDKNALQAMLAAAPVPPAGDVEVLPERKNKGWQCHSGSNPADGWNECLDACEPIVARLQAYIDAWKATAETFEDFYRKTEAERDALKAEVDRSDSALTAYADEVANLHDENLRLQSELTKAREWQEVAISFINSLRVPQNKDQAAWQVMQAARVIEGYERLAHQSAPAVKICECGPLRNVTDGGHFPACTRCHRRLKP